jgi:glycosyltransferase involved in cell wall biosynthesis
MQATHGFRLVNGPATDDRPLPLAVVMISFNEQHNMNEVLANISGWAQEVFLVDSYSSDRTVDIALARGVTVVQRRFRGFGDQWNYAVQELPIQSPWTMKLDPDERITPELKASIETAIRHGEADALVIRRRLWFMGRPLPVRQDILRLWRTGTCRFSEVTVNEHPLVRGRSITLQGELEHHDSPSLHHWYDKQNRYSTAEAIATYRGSSLAASPKLFGSALERRMWIKKFYGRIPFRHFLVHLYCLLWLGAWRAGPSGRIWARMRGEVYRMREYKLIEMVWRGQATTPPTLQLGAADPRVQQIADSIDPEAS